MCRAWAAIHACVGKSRAVVTYDARALAKQITCLKQELRGRAARAAPAGVDGA